MTKITNVTLVVVQRFCVHLQTQSELNYHLEKTLAQEERFSQNLTVSHDANCRWDLYPLLCHRTHGAATFPLKIISVCLSLLLGNINSLTAIEGIIYPITLQIICNQY